MSRPAVETAFRSIAEAIDRVGEAATPLFLARLSLLLCNELEDAARIQDCIDRALADIETTNIAPAGSGGPQGERR